MKEREAALEKAWNRVIQRRLPKDKLSDLQELIADAILEAQAEEVLYVCVCGNRNLDQFCPHKERAAHLRAQITGGRT